MVNQEFPSTSYEQAEAALMHLPGFIDLVCDLRLADVVVPTPWARKPMESLDGYELVPTWGTSQVRGRRTQSLDVSGYNNRTNDKVTVEYWEMGHDTPHRSYHMNARRGMVLTKNDRAIAVTSAGINNGLLDDQPAELVIRQVQGLVKNDKQPELARALRAGFLWRDTLVNAWEAIAVKIPAVGRIALAPDDSSLPDEMTSHFWEVHSEVADRQGFSFDIERRLWVKDI